MKPLKQPLCFSDQIKRLKEVHELCITDDNKAEAILKKVNYYRLSAYGIGLKVADNPDKYISGISIEHIYRLYHFDAQLRNALYLVIEKLEVELRTKLAYHLAMTYGAEGYRNSANFITKHNKDGLSIHSITMDKLDKEIVHQKNLPCVKHHISEYGGHFPAWAAFELFTFGMLSSLYSVMTVSDRQAIASQYRTDPYHFSSWILSLIEIRNICAHFNRLYNMPLKQQPKLYSEYQQYQSNRLFPALLVIKRMTNSDDVWVTFFITLTALMENYPEAKLSFLGFPSNWAEVLGA